MNEQSIIMEVGQALWSIMPRKAKTITFQTQLYDGFGQSTVFWTTRWGRPHDFGFDEFPEEIVFRIEDLLKTLRETERYVAEPFTHAEVSLSSASKVNLKFAHVSEDNSWAGLFMKGVSDLALFEATGLGISEDHWKDCVARFGEDAGRKP